MDGQLKQWMHSRVHVGVHVQGYVRRCVLLDVQDVLHVLELVDQVVMILVDLFVVVVQLLVREAAAEVVQKHAVVVVLDNVIVLVQDVEAIVPLDVQPHVALVVKVGAILVVRDAVLIVVVMQRAVVVMAVVVHAQATAMKVVAQIVKVVAQQVALVGVKQELKWVHHVQELHAKVSVKVIVQVVAQDAQTFVEGIVRVAAQLNALVAVELNVDMVAAAVVAVDVLLHVHGDVKTRVRAVLVNVKVVLIHVSYLVLMRAVPNVKGVETLVEQHVRDVPVVLIVRHVIHHVPMVVKAVEISVIQLVLVGVWTHV